MITRLYDVGTSWRSERKGDLNIIGRDKWDVDYVLDGEKKRKSAGSFSCFIKSYKFKQIIKNG